MLRQRYRSQRGASMAEAAIVMIILVTAVVGIIEVSRYYILKAQMTRAAKSGLELAIRNDHLIMDVVGADATQRTQIRAAAEEVSNRSAAFPVGNVMLADSVSPILGNISFTGTWPDVDLISDTDVILLRPGENGTYRDPHTGDFHQVRHPTYDPPSGTPRQDMVELLREHPILVEMNGRMRTLLPFIGPIHVRGQAIGMAELPPIGIEAVPGDPEFTAPGCGDGVYTPGAEDCDRVGSLHLGTRAWERCTSTCQKKHRCGDGIRDVGITDSRGSTYTEQCDGQDGVTEYETKCVWRCRLQDIAPCANGRCDPGEECDRLASLDDGDPTNDACAAPDNSSCVELESAGGICKIVALPDCEGELKVVKCGVDNRFECLVCVGEEGGDCGNGVLDDGERCDIADNVNILPGLKPRDYCDGCLRVIDRCGNGVFDGTVGSYAEQCDSEGGAIVPPVPDDKYCNNTGSGRDCQIYPKCGNRRVDPASGSYPAEECDDANQATVSAADRAAGYSCANCQRVLAPCVALADPCPDGSQPTWVEQILDSKGNIIVEGRCDCPAEIGS